MGQHGTLVQAIEQALFLQKASDASSTIRERLAAVANELRSAAQDADAATDRLLRLASHLEHASMGDDQ